MLHSSAAVYALNDGCALVSMGVSKEPARGDDIHVAAMKLFTPCKGHLTLPFAGLKASVFLTRTLSCHVLALFTTYSMVKVTSM